jgi:hypothetical protein
MVHICARPREGGALFVAGETIQDICQQYTGIYDGPDGVAFCRVVVDNGDAVGAVIEPDRRPWGGASILALLNCLNAVAARARTSISAVAEAGVNMSSGTNRGDAVAARDRVSEVFQKKDGKKPATKIILTGMQSMCCIKVANAGYISG